MASLVHLTGYCKYPPGFAYVQISRQRKDFRPASTGAWPPAPWPELTGKHSLKISPRPPGPAEYSEDFKEYLRTS